MTLDRRGLMRRALGLPLLALPLGASADPAAPGGTTTREIMIARARATLDAIRRHFGAGAGEPYREHHPAREDDHRYADEWPFSQVHIGVLDLACTPGGLERFGADLAAHRRAQERYWEARSANGLPGYASRVVPPHGPGGDLYYDDNDWVGLAMDQHWRFFHDPASLERAKTIYALVRSAWDDDASRPSPGGLLWTQQPGNTDRNTVSNMPAAQLALRLHQATGEARYLDEALRYRDWTNRTLQREDGLFLDHIDAAGRIDRRIFSYNQGVPIGVNVLLHRATGDAAYLAEAKRIAAASHRYFIAEGRLDRHSLPFNAIFFKNLLLLESVTGTRDHAAAMRGYADRMWAGARDVATGLFKHPGTSKPSATFQLIDQGAMLQILAVLAWDPADYTRLY